MRFIAVLFRLIYIVLAMYFIYNGYTALAIISLIASIITRYDREYENDKFVKIDRSNSQYHIDHYINVRYVAKIQRIDGHKITIVNINGDEYEINEKEWNIIRKTFKIKEPFKEWKK